MWVEVDVWHDIQRLDGAAELFDSHIYPRVRAAFGSEWKPGVDNDPRIHILHVGGLGENVHGYTSSLDEYPSELHPLSNEAEMIVVNVDHVDVGSSTYNAMLARQFQRLVQWNQDRNEERWLKEGLAELAVALTGFEVRESEGVYPVLPDTPLIHWTAEEGQREVAYSFVAYFHQRFGDEGTRILTSEPANGIRGIEAALRKLGSDLSFDALFADWLVANYMASAAPGDPSGQFSQDGDPDRPRPVAVHEAYPVETEGTVRQFGAHYVVLRGNTDLTVQFRGHEQVPMLSISPHSGERAWWSNRADESLTTLTRSLDLSAVDEATLIYWTWYDIEAHYDYVTVAVRALESEDWRILRTPAGTAANPYGNSPGWSHTGKSDGWIREEVDLSDYAGEEILLRFSYLTDGAVVGEGLLLDDISVPEIDYTDDAETGRDGWKAEGFLRIDALVPQHYLVVLVGCGEETTVERLPLRENMTAEWAIPLSSKELDEVVLIVSGMTRLTDHPAPYQLRISP